MLDLSFVRDHLELVEEKMRQRGQDPAVVLKDFRALDTRRRQAIHQAESLKAQRNRASEEVARLKKKFFGCHPAILQSAFPHPCKFPYF